VILTGNGFDRSLLAAHRINPHRRLRTALNEVLIRFLTFLSEAKNVAVIRHENDFVLLVAISMTYQLHAVRQVQHLRSFAEC
jgi:hypothetical protein